MTKKALVWFSVIIALLLIVPFFWGSYNRLVKLEETVCTSWAQVENQYQRRIYLIPNLMQTVKGYAAHEQKTFTQVIEARAKATQLNVDASNIDSDKLQQFDQVQGELSKALSRLMVVVENYPDLKAYLQFVSDPDNAVSYQHVHTLNNKLKEIRDSLNVQSAVVVIPAIAEEYATAKDFATELFNEWSIGDKESNKGLLIVLITGDGEREIAFETGYGLEEKLPDGVCKLIQTNNMLPYFKEGKYGAGLVSGISEVEKVLKGNSNLVDGERWPKEATWFIVVWIVIGLLVIWMKSRSSKTKSPDDSKNYKSAINSNDFMGVGCAIAILFFPAFILYAIFKGASGKNKGGAKSVICESCNAAGGVKLMGQPKIKQTAIPGQDGIKEYSFKCSKCGHIHTELAPYVYVEKTSSSTSSNNSWKSTGGSKGLSRGGSWDGGSSGGGGALTKF